MAYQKPEAPNTTELELSPAAQDRNLGSLVIDKTADPYVVEWYNDQKQPGDTPERFLLREIYAAALRHRAAKLVRANAGPGRADANGEPIALDNHADQCADFARYVGEEQSRLAGLIEGVLP